MFAEVARYGGECASAPLVEVGEVEQAAFDEDLPVAKESVVRSQDVQVCVVVEEILIVSVETHFSASEAVLAAD